jgi:hypothetical protein
VANDRAVTIRIFQEINENLRLQSALLTDLEALDGVPFHDRGRNYRVTYSQKIDALDDLNIKLQKLKRMVRVS